ncbi:MAG: hypothetical protein J7578_03920 [Chitinophagaceae bacterium]|nr:hypothetical protein [Chitinophagaceae bacterium]
MALILEGYSTCAICNQVLDKDRAYIGTPATTSNMLDDLFQMNDCGIHVDCLDAHPLKEKLTNYLERLNQLFPFDQQTCIVDGQPITNISDFFCTFLLTSDPAEALFKFNYLVINQKNIPKWKDREEFIFEVKRFLEEGKWKAFNDHPYLQNILLEMEQ